jgi:hypothetical protein
MPASLRFYFDITCPYAYVASTKVEALAERTGATLIPCPILLGGVFRAHETPQKLFATLPPGARIVVSELMPCVVEWNRGPLGHLAGNPLEDRRVVVGDLEQAVALLHLGPLDDPDLLHPPHDRGGDRLLAFGRREGDDTPCAQRPLGHEGRLRQTRQNAGRGAGLGANRAFDLTRGASHTSRPGRARQHGLRAEEEPTVRHGVLGRLHRRAHRVARVRLHHRPAEATTESVQGRGVARRPDREARSPSAGPVPCSATSRPWRARASAADACSKGPAISGWYSPLAG